MSTSSAQLLSSASNVITPKGSVWKVWEPFLVVPFWPQRRRDDDDDDDDDEWPTTLPGYRPCPIVSRLPESTPLPTKELQRFVNKKLYRDASFESLVMVVVIQLVVVKEPAADRWEGLRTQVPSTTSFEPDDYPWLMEGWPLIQDWISWEACCRLYHVIYTHLHLITLPHPLTTFAADILLDLSEPEFQLAVEGMIGLKLIPDSSPYNRLRVSQHLLDYVASVPVRRVGVLLQDPFVTMDQDHESILPQSCLPSAALELVVATDSSTIVQCHVIALYEDDDSSHSTTTHMTISSRPPPPPMSCSCPRCTFHRDQVQYCASIRATPISSSQRYAAVKEAQRLAHGLFQDQQYDDAQTLYRMCYDLTLDSKIRTKAELWHAMAAVELTRRRFLQAQRQWSEHRDWGDVHSGIAVQLEKQEAYGYWTPLPSCGRHSRHRTSPTSNYDTLSPQRLFLSQSLIPKDTCQQLIKWAEEYGRHTQDGWTTARHYAVPTHDIPIHKVPPLLEWFQNFMSTDCQVLLREQYQTRGRFYVHDAFLVRYSASAQSRFLPLHYDESTHSMVLALNDDFEGGGTYFYNVDTTISPSTGSLVTFRGDQMLHGGNLVTKGTRYILAVFLYLDDPVDEHPADACDKTLRWENSCSNKRPKMTTNGGFSFDFF